MNLKPTLALLTAVMLAACNRKAPPAPQQGPVNVTVAKPIAKKIVEWDEFTGRLASPQTVELRARVSGYVDKVHFSEGKEVKAGDILFTIDPRPYQAAVDRAEAEVGRAKQKAELAHADAKRGDALLASKTIATEDYDQRVRAAGEADQAVLSAVATLNSAKLDLDFTTVHAPISGRISDARVTAGNLVMGGATSATLLTTIVSLDPLYCYVEVDENSALKYRQLHRDGKRESAIFKQIPARMALGNETGWPREGHVDFVDNQLNPNTGSIRCRAVFPNPDHLMAPGFFARISIPGTGEYEAVMIRDSAVGSDQGNSFVFVVGEGEKAQYRAVQTGPIVDGLRVIRSGLKPDERVLLTGLVTVRNGSPVTAKLVDMNETTTPAAEPVK